MAARETLSRVRSRKKEPFFSVLWILDAFYETEHVES